MLDTNVFVSALLPKNSLPCQAVKQAFMSEVILSALIEWSSLAPVRDTTEKVSRKVGAGIRIMANLFNVVVWSKLW